MSTVWIRIKTGACHGPNCLDSVPERKKIRRQQKHEKLSSMQRIPINVLATVLPAKSDSDVMLCLQSYQGLMIDRLLVH